MKSVQTCLSLLLFIAFVAACSPQKRGDSGEALVGAPDWVLSSGATNQFGDSAYVGFGSVAGDEAAESPQALAFTRARAEAAAQIYSVVDSDVVREIEEIVVDEESGGGSVKTSQSLRTVTKSVIVATKGNLRWRDNATGNHYALVAIYPQDIKAFLDARIRQLGNKLSTDLARAKSKLESNKFEEANLLLDVELAAEHDNLVLILMSVAGRLQQNVSPRLFESEFELVSAQVKDGKERFLTRLDVLKALGVARKALVEAREREREGNVRGALELLSPRMQAELGELIRTATNLNIDLSGENWQGLLDELRTERERLRDKIKG